MSINVLDQAAVAANLPPVSIVRQALRDAFAALARGLAVQPPQALTLLPDDAGDFITYSAVANGLIGVKVSPYLTGRPPGEKVTAWTMLMSTATGQPVLLCDSLALTTERTAGTTALAVDLLAPPGSTTLAIIGSGPVARAHLRHTRALRPWTEIRVFSPSLAGAVAPAEFAAAGARVCASVEEAVRGAGVVMCCTSAAAPLVDVGWLEAQALVTSVSTNATEAHEIDPAQLAMYRVTCDYRATAPLSAGEMVIARREHGWDPASIVADLAELVSGAAPVDGGPTFFRSIGLGLEDIAIASLLVDGLGG